MLVTHKLGTSSLTDSRTNLFEQGGNKAANTAEDENGNKGGGGAGWDVLNDGFTGLSGRKKLKDWDREEEEDLEEQMETIQDESEEELEEEEEI